MKRYFWFALAIFVLAFAYSASKGQSTMEIQRTPITTEPRTPKQWVLSWENSFDSEFSAPNKAEIIDRPVVKTSTRFTNYKPNQIIWIETNAGHTVSRTSSQNYIVGVNAGIERKFGKYQFTVDGEVNYTPYHDFGRIGGEVSRTFSEKSVTFKPFSRFDYYFPTDNFGGSNVRRRMNNGVAWSNGIDSQIKVPAFAISNRSQVIVDSGSILPGRRTLFATEVTFGLNYGRICFGPKVDYVRHVAGSGWSGMKKNSFGGGFFIRYQ